MQRRSPQPAPRLAGGIISYHDPGTADDYRTWDDGAAWLLGYAFLPKALDLAGRPPSTLLDLGCGPGEVTRWLADRCTARITAVDSSERMVELARTHAPHPRIGYHHSADGLPSFLPDGAMDAATACFLFTCIDDEATLRALIAETARVLRPGGRFTVLMPNPDHVSGDTFEGFRRGDPGASYAPGELMPVHVNRSDGSRTTINNRYWPRPTFRTALAAAGFGTVTELTPLLADAAGVADPALFGDREWAAERTAAPFILYTAEK